MFGRIIIHIYTYLHPIIILEIKCTGCHAQFDYSVAAVVINILVP